MRSAPVQHCTSRERLRSAAAAGAPRDARASTRGCGYLSAPRRAARACRRPPPKTYVAPLGSFLSYS
eukprot:2839004-Rhodomonas_salina.1